MNCEDEFERRLQSHPQRQIPASWRAGILRVAKAAVPQQAMPAHRAAGTSHVISWLRGWLWPAPQAWAGLTAVWLVVLAVDLSSREPSAEASASRAIPPSAQSQEMLREQRELLAELVGPPGPTEATKPPIPRPRSERQEQRLMA